jgi:hypothetical protein
MSAASNRHVRTCVQDPKASAMLGNHLVLHGVRHQAGARGGAVALFGIVNYVAVCSVRASSVAWS